MAEAAAALAAEVDWSSEEPVKTDLILPMVEADEPSPLSQLSAINLDSTAAVKQAIQEEAVQSAQSMRDDEDDRRAQLQTNSNGQADTAALLRELSGLFQSGSEDGRSTPPPPQAPRPPAPAAKDAGKPKRKGLFGR